MDVDTEKKEDKKEEGGQGEGGHSCPLHYRQAEEEECREGKEGRGGEDGCGHREEGRQEREEGARASLRNVSKPSKSDESSAEGRHLGRCPLQTNEGPVNWGDCDAEQDRQGGQG